jgi:hypothetical protein
VYLDPPLAGPADLRSAGLALIGGLEGNRLHRQLAEYAAEADEEILTRMLRTAINSGAVPRTAERGSRDGAEGTATGARCPPSPNTT